MGHHCTSFSFLMVSAFFAACLLGRISPAGSLCSSSTMVLFAFAISNGTKCWMGLLIVNVLLVFSWYPDNSTPRILLSRLSKNFVTYTFRQNNFDLFLALIRTTSPIFNAFSTNVPLKLYLHLRYSTLSFSDLNVFLTMLTNIPW